MRALVRFAGENFTLLVREFFFSSTIQHTHIQSKRFELSKSLTNTDTHTIRIYTTKQFLTVYMTIHTSPYLSQLFVFILH